MLIQTEVQKGDIVTIKLVNGDEIVAELLETNSDSWTVKRPCTVIPSPQGIGLMQSLFTGQLEKVSIKTMHMIMSSKSVDEIVKHYLSTTTGLVTSGSNAPKGLIV